MLVRISNISPQNDQPPGEHQVLFLPSVKLQSHITQDISVLHTESCSDKFHLKREEEEVKVRGSNTVRSSVSGNPGQ